MQPCFDELVLEEIASHVLDRLMCTDRTVSEQVRLMPSMFLPEKVCKLTDERRTPFAALLRDEAETPSEADPTTRMGKILPMATREW